MKINLLLPIGLLFIGLLASCNPRVLSQIVRTCPPVTYSDMVAVYTDPDSLPNQAEVVGRVLILDNGFTRKCQYDYVIQLAREQVAYSGGNALLITDHIFPSWISSCHQLTASMIRVDNWNVDTAATYSPIRESLVETLKVMKKQRLGPLRNAISVSGGLGYCYSLIPIEGYNNRHLLSSEWGVAYNRIGMIGAGVGLVYMGSYSQDAGCSLLTTYAAIEILQRGKVSTSCLMKGGIGIGYMGCKLWDGSYYGGVGMNVNIGFEYVFSKHVGLGAELGGIFSLFPSDKDRDSKMSSGIVRLKLEIGPRFYF